MSENELDPSGSTQQFRAFAQRGEAESSQARGINVGLIVGVAVAVIVVLAVIVAIAVM
jgi:hypothetical protein